MCRVAAQSTSAVRRPTSCCGATLGVRRITTIVGIKAAGERAPGQERVATRVLALALELTTASGGAANVFAEVFVNELLPAAEWEEGSARAELEGAIKQALEGVLRARPGDPLGMLATAVKELAVTKRVLEEECGA